MKERDGYDCYSKKEALTSQSENGGSPSFSSLVCPRTFFIVVLDADWPGDIDVTETQCVKASEDYSFPCISLQNVLFEKSTDTTYLHANVLRHYLDESLDVPIDLVVSLLEKKIEESGNEGQKWCLVYGFPKKIDHFLEFERKVSISDMGGALLTFPGSKNKLHAASEPLSRK